MVMRERLKLKFGSGHLVFRLSSRSSLWA